MKGIKKKIFLSYILVIAVILILFWLTQVVFLRKIYINSKVNELKALASYIAKNIDQQEKLYDAAERWGVRLVIVDERGEIILNNRMRGGGMGHGMGAGAGMPLPLLYQYKPGVYYYNGTDLKMEHLAVVQNYTHDSSRGRIILSIPMSSIDDNVKIFKSLFWWIGALSVLFSFALSWAFSRRFIVPIDKLKEAAGEISRGNFKVKVSDGLKDEFKDLALSIEDMALDLDRVDKLKKDFIANMTHDLKTPLGLIRGYAEMLLDFYGDEKERRDKYLNTIISESQRMSALIDSILSLSKLQSGYIKLDISEFNLYDLVEEVLRAFEVELNKKEIKVILNGLDVRVQGDRELLKRVFINTIDNSLKNMDTGGSLSIFTYIKGDAVEVNIKDTGRGIPSDKIDGIFDRYYKLDKSGTGLGLAIVGEILKLHKSQYGIESREGIGTTFYFTIKLAKPAV